MELSNDFLTNVSLINEKIGIGQTFDTNFREYQIYNKQVYLYFLSGLVSNLEIIGVNEKLLKLPASEPNVNYYEQIKNNICHESIAILTTIENICDHILNGFIVLMIEGVSEGIAIETRSYPARSIAEPDTEKVIRGSHDGFTENFSVNVALIRRRIKDGRLRNVLFNIGSSSPTYVCLSYIEGVCDENIVEVITNKLKQIQTDHLIMADKALEELLLHQTFNPYPLVRYTERADIVSIHLYKGSFAIFVDTSPSVILAPATFFDHMQHAEEYRQTPISGTYLRLLRYIGVFLSLFLTPVWLLAVMNEITLPAMFDILTPDKSVHTAIFLQILAAEIGVEFLRMASIHTPSALSTAMGLVAGILIGDVAIKVGVFSTQTVFVIAISTIGTYITPSYELGLANKLSKIVFLIAIYFWGMTGFIVALFLWFCLLATQKSFNRYYLYPLIPFNFKKLLQVIIRVPNKEVKRNAKIKM